VIIAVWNHGLAKTNTGAAQLLQLGLGKLGMALFHEVDRLVHPDDLVLGVRLDDAALLYGTEKLIAGSVESRLRTPFRPTANPSLTRQSLLRVEGSECDGNVRHVQAYGPFSHEI
jgi:hypothetical protein